VLPRSNYTGNEESVFSFPNPILNNEHIVEISSNHNDKRSVIYVADVTGRMVNSLNAKLGENVLDLSNVNNGVYIIEVFSEGVKLFTIKVVKL
jgi:hypothetical protein